MAVYEFGVGTFDIETQIPGGTLPDEHVVIVGKSPGLTKIKFSSLVGAFSALDRSVEIHDCELLGRGGTSRLVKFTFPAGSWQKPHVIIANVHLSCDRVQLGGAWLATFINAVIRGCEIGIESIGRLMGLNGKALSIYPANDTTAIGVLVNQAQSEGAHFEMSNVVGGMAGWVIDLPDEGLPPRPGWHWRGCHADTRVFGWKLWRVAQAFLIGCLGYRRGSGAHNGVNTFNGTQRVEIGNSHFVNNGDRAGATAIALGSGTSRVTVQAGWQGYEKGLWIQTGADRTRYDDCQSPDTTMPVVNDGTNTSAGTVVL